MELSNRLEPLHLLKHNFLASKRAKPIPIPAKKDEPTGPTTLPPRVHDQTVAIRHPSPRSAEEQVPQRQVKVLGADTPKGAIGSFGQSEGSVCL